MLLPELESPEVAAAARTIRNAVGSIDLKNAEVILLMTPHAEKAGVYREVRGDLSAFGVGGVAVDIETVDGSGLGLPTIEGPADHGVTVPLLLREWDRPVIAVGVDGEPIPVQIDAPIAVVASVNTSAGLSSRAPLTELPDAREAEQRFVHALQRDVGSIDDVELPATCSSSVISVFAELFGGRSAKVLAREAPVGVGYLVAEVV